MIARALGVLSWLRPTLAYDCWSVSNQDAILYASDLHNVIPSTDSVMWNHPD